MEKLKEKIDLNALDKSEWVTFRFEEIAKKVSITIKPEEADVDIYVGLEHIDPEDIHIRRRGVPSDVKGGKLKCSPGDVIFGKRRAYQRKAAIVDFEGICSAHAFVFRANSEVIDPQLFPFFLHSDQFMHRMVDISVGGLSPTINWGDLKHQEFLLPPKDQQTKLAELLWAMDEVVEKEKKVLNNLDISKRSYERNNLLKYSSSSQFKLPNGHFVFKLDQIADITGGSTPSRNNEKYWGGNIPWLTPTDVTRHDRINLSNTKECITDLGLKNISNRLYPPGTILYCSRATIGHAIINDVEMSTNQGFSNFIVNEKVRTYFLYFLLKHVTPELTRLAGGSTFLEISKSAMRNFKVVIPSLEIQEKIEGKLMEIESNRLLLESQISTSKSLQKSLINQIF